MSSKFYELQPRFYLPSDHDAWMDLPLARHFCVAVGGVLVCGEQT